MVSLTATHMPKGENRGVARPEMPKAEPTPEASEIGSSEIKLTDDKDLIAKLERKLVEYKNRMEFQPPEISPIDTFKLRILQELLTGSLNAEALRKEYEDLSWYDEKDFDQALRIIEKYNNNDQSRLVGGTGLK